MKKSQERKTAGRRPPMVWVKEIVLYETLDPLVELNRLDFHVGINIVQGELSDSAKAFESGHGIGKTTLCRLIRHCLGEKSYGQKHIVEEVRNCFPTAHVGAVVEVAGVEWSIIRKLGERGRNLAKANIQLVDLVSAEGPKTFDEFTIELERATLEGLDPRNVLSSDQSIDWFRLLAMCSRDQECRFDRFWHWRHERSRSLTQKFGKPKVDAGLFVRAILGLLDPKEPKLRGKIEDQESELQDLGKEIEKKQAEPAFRVAELRKDLKNDFEIDDADDASIDSDELFGIENEVTQKLELLKGELAAIDDQLVPLDRKINMATVALKEVSEMRNETVTARDATNEATDELTKGITELEEEKAAIENLSDVFCPPGNLFVGECSIVQARKDGLNDLIVAKRAEVMPEASKRDQLASELTERAKRQESPVSRQQGRLDELNRQKNDLLERRLKINDQIEKLPLACDEIKKWHKISKGMQPNSALADLSDRKADLEKKIGAAKKRLNKLLDKQRERVVEFESRFNSIVQKTINQDFKGLVDISEDHVGFRIVRGNSLAGEAYETLAVLLADIAILIESASPNVYHPGLLIHDSPREADLNIRIYERMLEVALTQMRELGSSDSVPFQYIVTTTTPPAEQMKGKFIHKRTLSSGKGSLFGMQLEGALHERTKPLFDDSEDE